MTGESTVAAVGIPERRFFSMAQVESLKWLALVLMLLEHFFRYVLDSLPGWVYLAGRLVFPLFVVALAIGLAEQAWGKVRQTMLRLFTWGLIAQVGTLFVTLPAPRLNVLFTFALGVLMHYALACAGSVTRVVLAAVVVISVAPFCDFGLWGVAFVVSVLALARTGWRSLPGWVFAAGTLIGLAIPNGVWFALLAVPVLGALHFLQLEVPRIRGFFYWAYALQFPVFAATAWVLS